MSRLGSSSPFQNVASNKICVNPSESNHSLGLECPTNSKVCFQSSWSGRNRTRFFPPAIRIAWVSEESSLWGTGMNSNLIPLLKHRRSP